MRAIGVSNFMVRHVVELLARAKAPPAVNQIEASPFLQQRDGAVCHCITLAACVSALVNQVREGTPPSEQDLRAPSGAAAIVNELASLP